MILVVILLLCLTFISSSNATTKKGWFGDEKRVNAKSYSIAEIEGFTIHASEDSDSLTYTVGDKAPPYIQVSKLNENEDNITDFWKEIYPVTSYTTLKKNTSNELNISIYKTKSASIYGGAEGYTNYVTYAVGKKDGCTFCIANQCWNAGELNDTSINTIYLYDSNELFAEIFNSIEVKNESKIER